MLMDLKIQHSKGVSSSQIKTLATFLLDINKIILKFI